MLRSSQAPPSWAKPLDYSWEGVAMRPLPASGHPGHPGRSLQSCAAGRDSRGQVVCGLLAATGCIVNARRARRCTALAAAATASKEALKKAAQRRRNKEQMREEANVVEGTLLALFEKEQPSIYKVRDCLTRLARLTSRPNQSLSGDWIIFWASREGCVDKTFGTGATVDETWLEMQEYLLRIGSRKEGRPVEAAEVLRKVGPFPNMSNSLRGKYEITGTNGLRLVFNDFKTDEDKDVEVKGKKLEEKIVEVDVIYSSPALIAMQTEDESGECDFYVLTPVRDLKQELNKLLGLERRRFFFN